MGAGMALLIALFQRRMGWQRFYEVMRETAMTSVMLYVVLFGAMLFAKLISFSGLADSLLMLVEGSGLSRWASCWPSWRCFWCWAASWTRWPSS
jgi:TRAP-type C4-dicarboxylate transport system permease large subunit